MKDFLDHMRYEKNKAENTLIAYERDLKSFERYLRQKSSKELNDCSESDAVSYVFDLGKDKKSRSTINRKVSVLRTYYDFEIEKGAVKANPFGKIKAARAERRRIEYLSIEEAAALMEMPDNDDKGIRDRALMEFMYGTGARVTEVGRLKFSDVNLRMKFVTLKDVNEESRIVPLGTYASEAMSRYIYEVYDGLIGREHTDDDYVFVNMRGEPLTRQGIWKILKDYGSRLGTEERMTPQILRDSFAVHILQNGGDLKTLQELMGFEDMTIGIAYLAVTDIHVRDVFKRCHPRA